MHSVVPREGWGCSAPALALLEFLLELEHPGNPKLLQDLQVSGCRFPE